jgi:hypothetical protein
MDGDDDDGIAEALVRSLLFVRSIRGVVYILRKLDATG